MPVVGAAVDGQGGTILLFCLSAAVSYLGASSGLEYLRNMSSMAHVRFGVLEEGQWYAAVRGGGPTVGSWAQPSYSATSLLVSSGSGMLERATQDSLRRMVRQGEIRRIVIEDAERLLPQSLEEGDHKGTVLATNVAMFLSFAVASGKAHITLSSGTMDARMTDLVLSEVGLHDRRSDIHRICLSPASHERAWSSIRMTSQPKERMQSAGNWARSTNAYSTCPAHPAFKAIRTLVEGTGPSVVIFARGSWECHLQALSFKEDGHLGQHGLRVAELHSKTHRWPAVNDAGPGADPLEAFNQGLLDVLVCSAELTACARFEAKLIVELNVPRSIPEIARHACRVKPGGEYRVFVDKKDGQRWLRDLSAKLEACRTQAGVEEADFRLRQQREALLLLEEPIGCWVTRIFGCLGVGLTLVDRSCSTDFPCATCAWRQAKTKKYTVTTAAGLDAAFGKDFVDMVRRREKHLGHAGQYKAMTKEELKGLLLGHTSKRQIEIGLVHEPPNYVMKFGGNAFKAFSGVLFNGEAAISFINDLLWKSILRNLIVVDEAHKTTTEYIVCGPNAQSYFNAGVHSCGLRLVEDVSTDGQGQARRASMEVVSRMNTTWLETIAAIPEDTQNRIARLYPFAAKEPEIAGPQLKDDKWLSARGKKPRLHFERRLREWGIMSKPSLVSEARGSLYRALAQCIAATCDASKQKKLATRLHRACEQLLLRHRPCYDHAAIQAADPLMYGRIEALGDEAKGLLDSGERTPSEGDSDCWLKKQNHDALMKILRELDDLRQTAWTGMHDKLQSSPEGLIFLVASVAQWYVGGRIAVYRFDQPGEIATLCVPGCRTTDGIRVDDVPDSIHVRLAVFPDGFVRCINEIPSVDAARHSREAGVAPHVLSGKKAARSHMAVAHSMHGTARDCP